MSDNIVEFKPRDADETERHLEGDARCVCCGHNWVAVAPIGESQLQCPECETFKGVFVNPVVPRHESMWTCDCGCDLFYVSPEGLTCYQCGDEQDFS